MPTYQYACTEISCGHRFEAVQSFSDAALTSCPVCSGSLRKVFSSVGVVFKGSGFYRTDSRGPEKKTGSELPAKESKKDSTKSDASATSGSASSASKDSGSKSSGDSSSSSKPAAGSSTTAKAAAP